MPRKAPDKVIEHRISLSNFERTKIMEELERTRTNNLIKSGISQVGSIAGSGVLLWGIGAYLGFGIFSAGFDKVSTWVNNTSSGLADFLNPAGVGNYSDEEASRVTRAFNLLDHAIVDHRTLERANIVAIQGQIAMLQRGEITYDEFRAQFDILKAEASDLDQLRLDILATRNVVTWIRNEFNYDRGEIPAWFDAYQYQDLIESAKGYDLTMASTTGYEIQFPN